MLSDNPRFKTPEALAPYHILSVEALYKAGKTHFASHAPGPLVIQSTDFSTDGPVQKAMAAGKRILVAEYPLAVDLTADDLFKEGVALRDDQKKELAGKAADRQAERVTRETWTPFRTDYLAALADPEVRTIVWDTADQVNEVLRLANHGKLERNPQMANGPINAEYKDLVRRAAAARKNLIMLHRLRDEYKDYEDPDKPGKTKNAKTGQMVRAGNANADYLVHSFVRLEYSPPKQPNPSMSPGTFKMTIKAARLNPAVTGQVLENATWQELMLYLAPDVDPSAWEDSK